MASLKTIQIVTNETLSRVKDVQATLGRMTKELDNLENLINKFSCDTALDGALMYVGKIRTSWDTYIDLSEQLTTAVSCDPDRALLDNCDPDRELLDRIEKWVDGVIQPGTSPVETAIIIIGAKIADEDNPQSGLLTRCGALSQSNYEKGRPLPYDDRALYRDLSKIITSLVTWQARGLHLMTEAYHWKAATAYHNRLRSAVANTCGSVLNTTCSEWTANTVFVDLNAMCVAALGLPTASRSPLQAAVTYCRSIQSKRDDVRRSVARSLELLGAPYSTGDTPGDGARLIVGVDYTLSDAARDVLQNDNKDSKIPYYPSTTRYLVPASLAQFDPRCEGSNVSVMAAKGCSLLGDASDTSNTAWATLKAPLGYPADLWQPAGIEPWATLRYGFNVSSVYNEGLARGDANNLLLMMERHFDAAYPVAFANVSRVPMWIANQSIPFVHFLDLTTAADGKSSIKLGPNRDNFWMNRNAGFYNVLAFVHGNATNDMAGPSGLVFSKTDLGGVSFFFSRWCGVGASSTMGIIRRSCSAAFCASRFLCPPLSPGNQRPVQPSRPRPRPPFFVRCQSGVWPFLPVACCSVGARSVYRRSRHRRRQRGHVAVPRIPLGAHHQHWFVAT